MFTTIISRVCDQAIRRLEWLLANNKRTCLILWLCAALLVLRVVLGSWVEEDAFITFRVVDNFLHGYGLRWNINERVQSYTNPLWMVLHIPVELVASNIIISTSLLGWGCLIATLVVTYKSFSAPYIRYTVLFLLPLLLAHIHALYFTSGLENPLLHLLFACFGYVLLRRPEHYWFRLSLIVSLSMVTRLDSVILYAPVMGYLLWEERRALPWLALIKGATPLFAWFLFSLWYYGFLLPNTAWAKLGGDLPVADYIWSGAVYSYDFLLADPWSALAIVLAVLYLPYAALRRRTPETALAAAITLGIWLYCLYVVYIGGAQLSMRMFSLPAFAACWLWAWRFPFGQLKHYGLFLLAGLLAQQLLAEPDKTRGQIPVIKEARIGSMPWARKMFRPSSEHWSGYELNAKDLWMRPDRKPRKPEVKVAALIGNLGYYSGPHMLIIDPVALSDPLLARLPAKYERLKKVGDIHRRLPERYEEAMPEGKAYLLPMPLSYYYYQIMMITRGPLWDKARLKNIWYFNTGRYDIWRDIYIKESYYRSVD